MDTSTEWYARRDELAAELHDAIEEGTLAFDHGWLVEVVHKHTCGTGLDGYYGMHEPGCGRVPIFDIAAAMLRSQLEAEAIA